MNSFVARSAAVGAAINLDGIIILARASLLLSRDRRQGDMRINLFVGSGPLLRFALSWLRCKNFFGFPCVIGIGPIRGSRHEGSIQQDLIALALGDRLKAILQQGL